MVYKYTEGFNKICATVKQATIYDFMGVFGLILMCVGTIGVISAGVA